MGKLNRSRYQRHREPDLEVSSEIHRPRVLIHASNSKGVGWIMNSEQRVQILVHPSELAGVDCNKLPRGAIIGSVVISDCVQNHPSVWAEQGCWNWVLKDAVLFDKPIMNVKGKLSFWCFNLVK